MKAHKFFKKHGLFTITFIMALRLGATTLMESCPANVGTCPSPACGQTCTTYSCNNPETMTFDILDLPSTIHWMDQGCQNKLKEEVIQNLPYSNSNFTPGTISEIPTRGIKLTQWACVPNTIVGTCNDCSHNGVKTPHGGTINKYLQSQVYSPDRCKKAPIVCNNGAWSPSPFYDSCVQKTKHTSTGQVCNSNDYNYVTCGNFGTAVLSVTKESQQSHSACTSGSSFGMTANHIWVSNGCRGTFTVIWED